MIHRKQDDNLALETINETQTYFLDSTESSCS